MEIELDSRAFSVEHNFTSMKNYWAGPSHVLLFVNKYTLLLLCNIIYLLRVTMRLVT